MMFCKQIIEDDIERTKANLRNNHFVLLCERRQ